MALWLLKTEPSTYSYDDLEREGRTVWDGVRNPVAGKHLRSMAVGDLCVVYHTGDAKAAIGLARVASAPRDEKGLPVVDLEPAGRLPRAVPLSEIKASPAFAESPLVRQGRLSVVPLTAAQGRTLGVRP